MTARLRPELQVTATECGLCCAAMILHAQGCRDTTAQLRAELDIGRDGATLSQLRDAFEARGIATKLFRANTEGLRRLDGPVIVFWENYHFVVVERITDDRVVVLDPAVGRRRLPRADFDESFSGLALHPAPGQAATLHDPEDGSRRTSSIRSLFLEAVRGTWVSVALIALCAVVTYGGMLALPILTQRLIDGAVQEPDGSVWAGRLPLYLALGVLCLTAASFLRAVFIARATIAIGSVTSERLMRHLLALPLKYFDTRQPGELAYRLNGIAAIRDTISGQAVTGIFEVGAVLVFVGYLLHRSTLLGLVAIAILIGLLVLLFGTRARVYSVLQNEIVQTGKSQTQQLEAIQSMLTIKAEGSNRFFMGRWKTENDLALRYLGERTRLQGAVNAVVGGVQLAAPLVILMIGLQAWQRQDLTLGQVIAAQAISISLFGSATSIYGSVTQLMMVRQYGRRLKDILDTEEEVRGDTVGGTWAPLEVRDVSYRYTKDGAPVLDGIDLVIRPGEKVAVVGATGSGKSTLARLVLGLYPPASGEVLYGGVPIGERDREDVMRDVAFVPQGITLETMSVRENITQGREMSPEEVRRACDLACVSADIEALPMGYETLVTNLGNNFSGGQKQRIGIARALARRPSLLVLDEATSSLDHATETAIMAGVAQSDCAALVIAHRLASVVAADRIYVMEKGRIVEEGDHATLLARRGTYWTMFGGQMQVGDHVA